MRHLTKIAACALLWTSCLSASHATAAAPEPLAPAAPAIALAPCVSGPVVRHEGTWNLWLRQRVAYQADWSKYGLRLDQQWESCPTASPVVVLLHGFNSTPARSESLICLAREQGLPCGCFAYPNDQPLDDSAALLSRELKRFAAAHPGRTVALVTHSMGGLVARACVEDEELNPGVVDQVIMVCPPSHGSMLARWAMGLDLWEHWISRSEGSAWQRTRDSFVDGLSEAPTDLRPGSKFLTRLNARDRNPAVRYTLLLGDRAQLSESQQYMLRQSLLSAADFTPGWESDAAAIDQLVSKLDEVIEGRGDGAVAICRGRLAGVADTHVLPFSHLSVVRQDDEPATQQVREIILQRLLSTQASQGTAPHHIVPERS